MKCFLVTATGGDLGQAVIQTLREAIADCMIVGTDITDGHAGLAMCDTFAMLPIASHPDYESILCELCRSHGVDAIFPVSEPEIRRLVSTTSPILEEKTITLGKQTVDTCLDKYETSRFLTAATIPGPWTVLSNHSPPHDGPFIYKARRGSGSKSVQRIDSLRSTTINRTKEYIFQELLPSDNTEFTCAVFRSSCGTVRTISLRRHLKHGMTHYGVVESHSEITAILHKVAEAFGFVGSANIQLRLTPNGPRIFEINPRFSSTTYFRHMLGFSDVAWTLEDRAGHPLSPYRSPTEGTEFFRTSSMVLRRP